MPRQGEIAPLTGLRGVAALMVVFAHYIGWTWIPDGPRPDLANWTSISGVAMAIFFTLSGYVIALSYSHWDWRARPVFNLVRLMLYRLARLYPAYLLFAVICIMRAPNYRDFLIPEVRNYLIPHLALVFTWYRVPFETGHSFPPESPFHLGWSLSVEWALYAGFAVASIIVTLLPKWPLKALILWAAFFWGTSELAHDASQLHPGVAADWPNHWWVRWIYFYSPLGVSQLFAAGVIAYRITLRSSFGTSLISNAGGLAMVAVIALLYLGAIPDTWHQWVTAASATVLILIGSSANSLTNRVLAGRPIVYVGVISYSLYLFHFLVPGVTFAGNLPAGHPLVAFYTVVDFAVAALLAICLASGVYSLVEAPSRKFLRVWADRALRITRSADPVPALR